MKAEARRKMREVMGQALTMGTCSAAMQATGETMPVKNASGPNTATSWRDTHRRDAA